MSEWLSSWLALRERVDHASRSRSLVDVLAAGLPAVRPLRIVDLGSGTGSNVRYLSPLLPAPQHWTTVDQDAALMREGASIRPLERANIVGIDQRVMNLGDFDPHVLDSAHVVTGSALLDLVSDRWLRLLAAACRATGASALFALTYNGFSECSPEEPEDARVLELFNAHQRQNDKGFGVAAGPDAVAGAIAAFTESGYQVRREPSSWSLTPDLQALQMQLIDGWAEAASEIAPAETGRIADWKRRRGAHVTTGRSRIVVGHDDICAVPALDSTAPV